MARGNSNSRSLSDSQRWKFCAYIAANKFALLTLVLCTLVYFTNQLDRFLNTSSKPPFVSKADNDEISGFLFTITYTLTGILISMFGSSWNRARVLGLAAMGWSIATALVGITNHFWQVAVLRISVSVFQAACTPFAAALIADAFPPYLKGFTLGIYNFGVYTGFGISQGLTAIGQENWRISWFIFGGIGLALGIVIWIVLSDSRKKQKKGEDTVSESLLESSVNDEQTQVEKKRMCPMASSLAKHWLTTPSLWLLSLAGGIRNAGGYVWGYNSKRWFKDTQGVSADTYSIRMSLIPLLAGSSGAILGGYLADRLLKLRTRNGKRCGPSGRVLVVIVSNLLAAPFAAGVLLSPASWHEDLGGFLCLIGSNLLGEMWIGICLALVTDLVPSEMRTTSVAIYLFIITNIGGNMPSAVTALAKAFPYDAHDQLKASLLVLYPGTYAASSVLFLFLLCLLRRDIKKAETKTVAPPDHHKLLGSQQRDEEEVLIAEAGQSAYSRSQDVEGDAPLSHQLRLAVEDDITNSELQYQPVILPVAVLMLETPTEQIPLFLSVAMPQGFDQSFFLISSVSHYLSRRYTSLDRPLLPAPPPFRGKPERALRRLPAVDLQPQALLPSFLSYLHSSLFPSFFLLSFLLSWQPCSTAVLPQAQLYFPPTSPQQRRSNAGAPPEHRHSAGTAGRGACFSAMHNACKAFTHAASRWFGALVLIVLAWTLLYLLTDDAALPDGYLFALLALFVAADVLGKVVALIGLPPLLGMLIAGFVLRNVPGIDVAESIPLSWSSPLKSFALVIILARAGFGMDIDALKRLKGIIIAMAAIPNIVEAVVFAVMTYLLTGYSIIWGFIAGFTLSAISPAVVVPATLKLQEGNYGTDQGIPTLILASSSFDDVLSITGFGIFLGIALSGSSLAFNILRGPIEIVLGIVLGLVLGLIVATVLRPARSHWSTHDDDNVVNQTPPDKAESLEDDTERKEKDEGEEVGEQEGAAQNDGVNIELTEIRKETPYPDAEAAPPEPAVAKTERQRIKERRTKYSTVTRTAVISLIGAVCVLGGKAIDFSGSGTIAVIVMALVLGRLWKERAHLILRCPCCYGGRRGCVAFRSDEETSEAAEVGDHLRLMWRFAQPVLFALIGAAVSVDDIHGSFVGDSLLGMLVSLTVRTLSVFLTLMPTNLLMKERAFLAMAWLPKATVQAAVGSVALDTARENNLGEDDINRGLFVLTAAVLSIVITAPIGALLINFFGPRLLRKAKDHTGQQVLSSVQWVSPELGRAQ